MNIDIETLKERIIALVDELDRHYVIPLLSDLENTTHEHSFDNGYETGFERVGCYPCLASGDKYKEKTFANDSVGKQRRIEVLDIGRVIGKNIFTTKGGRLRNLDADPFNELEVEYNPNNDEVSPCHQCNI